MKLIHRPMSLALLSAALLPLLHSSILAQETAPQPSFVEQKMQAFDFTTADEGEHLLYRQYSPPLKEGEKAGLLIFLHGYGERGSDNLKQTKHCAEDIIRYIEANDAKVFLLMPQCPDDMRWVRYIRPLENPPHKMDAYPTLPLQMVEKLIEAKIDQLPVDPDRVYIAGLSMGGFGTWEMLARRPDLFAAAIPICGGGDPQQAARFKDIPIQVFHGGADGVVPPAYSTLVVEQLKKESASEITYTEYPETGHDSWSQTCRNPEVLHWLFSQKRTR